MSPSDAAPPTPGDEDVGTVALEEAVRLAFGVLKLLMVLLVLLFLGSGSFQVASHQVAFVRHLGVLDPEPRQPGLHWRWPALDRVVALDLRPRTARTDALDVSPLADERPATRPRGLDPRRDGYVLTGNADLLHLALAARLAPRPPLHRAAVAARDPETLARVLLERAAVRTAARRAGDSLLRAGKADYLGAVARSLQGGLDAAQAGWAVQGVDLERDVRPPAAVRDAFEEVARSAQRADAERSEAAARATRVTARAQSEAGRIVSEAQGEAAVLEGDAEAHAARVAAFRDAWRADRRAVQARLLAETLADALGDSGEAFLVGDGELRLRLRRDASANREAAERAAVKGE